MAIDFKSKISGKTEKSIQESVVEKIEVNPQINNNKVDENSIIRIEENNRKKKLLTEERKPVDLDSLREAINSGDMTKLKHEGEKRKKIASDNKITNLTQEKFNKFETFIPSLGITFGVKYQKNSAVLLTEENEAFLKLMCFKKGVKRVSAVNHILDVVKEYFKDQL